MYVDWIVCQVMGKHPDIPPDGLTFWQRQLWRVGGWIQANGELISGLVVLGLALLLIKWLATLH